jgi:hypothetical protein
MKIDWTSVICSAVTASVIGGFQLFSNRYLARFLDTIERRLGIVKK